MPKAEFSLNTPTFWQQFLNTVFVFLLIGVLIFCCIKFTLNPTLFAIGIAFDLLILWPSLRTRSIEIFPHHLIIKLKGIANLFNKEDKIVFTDIREISYQERSFNPYNLIKYVPGSNKKPEIQITLNSGELIIIHQLGNENKFREAFRLMTNRVALRDTP